MEGTLILEDILEEERFLWLQSTRDKWIEDGERNTKFLHTSVIAKQAKRKIVRLKDANGEWIEFIDTLKETSTNNCIGLNQQNLAITMSGVFLNCPERIGEHFTGISLLIK